MKLDPNVSYQHVSEDMILRQLKLIEEQEGIEPHVERSPVQQYWEEKPHHNDELCISIFGRWQRFRSVRLQMRQAEQYATKQSIHRSVRHWASFRATRQHRKRQLIKIQDAKSQRYLQRWIRRVDLTKAIRIMHQEGSFYTRWIVLARFRDWKFRIFQKQRLVKLSRVSMRKYTRSVQKRCFVQLKLNYMTGQWGRGRLMRYFNAWNTFLQRKNELKELEDEFQWIRRDIQRQFALIYWKGWIKEKNQLQMSSRRVGETVLRSWLYKWIRLFGLRSVGRLGQQLQSITVQRNVLKAWRNAVVVRELHHRVTKSNRKHVFQQWCRFIQNERERKHKIAMVSSIAVHRAVCRLYQRVVARKERRKLDLKADKFRRVVLLAAYHRRLSLYCLERKQKRCYMAQVRIFLLRKAFFQVKRNSATLIHLRQVDHAVVERYHQRLLWQSFTQITRYAKYYRILKAQHKKADEHYDKRLLNWTLDRFKEQYAFDTRMRRLRQTAGRWHRINLLDRYLAQWMEYLISRRRLVTRVNYLYHAQCRKWSHRCMKAWYQRFKTLRHVDALCREIQHRRTQMLWSSWLKLVLIQRKRMSLEASRRQKLLLTCFGKWGRVYQVEEKLWTLQSRFHRKRHLKLLDRVWQQFRQATRQQSRISTIQQDIVCRRTIRLKQKAIVDWRLWTQHLHRVAEFTFEIDFRLLHRVFNEWVMYINVVDDLRRRYDRFTILYPSPMGCRTSRSFFKLKQYKQRRQEKAQLTRAVQYYLNRSILRQCLIQWKENVTMLYYYQRWRHYSLRLGLLSNQLGKRLRLLREKNNRKRQRSVLEQWHIVLSLRESDLFRIRVVKRQTQEELVSLVGGIETATTFDRNLTLQMSFAKLRFSFDQKQDKAKQFLLSTIGRRVFQTLKTFALHARMDRMNRNLIQSTPIRRKSTGYLQRFQAQKQRSVQPPPEKKTTIGTVPSEPPAKPTVKVLKKKPRSNIRVVTKSPRVFVLKAEQEENDVLSSMSELFEPGMNRGVLCTMYCHYIQLENDTLSSLGQDAMRLYYFLHDFDLLDNEYTYDLAKQHVVQAMELNSSNAMTFLVFSIALELVSRRRMEKRLDKRIKVTLDGADALDLESFPALQVIFIHRILPQRLNRCKTTQLPSRKLIQCIQHLYKGLRKLYDRFTRLKNIDGVFIKVLELKEFEELAREFQLTNDLLSVFELRKCFHGKTFVYFPSFIHLLMDCADILYIDTLKQPELRLRMLLFTMDPTELIFKGNRSVVLKAMDQHHPIQPVRVSKQPRIIVRPVPVRKEKVPKEVFQPKTLPIDKAYEKNKSRNVVCDYFPLPIQLYDKELDRLTSQYI